MKFNIFRTLLCMTFCCLSNISNAVITNPNLNQSYSFDADKTFNNGNKTQMLICSYVTPQGQIDNHIKVADNGHWARYKSIHPFTAFDAIFISEESYQSILNKCKIGANPNNRLVGIETVPEYALKSSSALHDSLKSDKFSNIMFSHDVYFSDLGHPNTYPFDRIVFFGDSLSDNSNDFRYYIYIMQKAFPGIYWDKRFSNGLMWGEWLSDGTYTKNGKGMDLPQENFAWGGAYAFTRRSEIIPSLITQVATYLDFINSNNLYADQEKTLYSVLSGGNDFMSTNHTPDEVAMAVDLEIKKLIDSARSRHLSKIYFLIPTLPDVSIVPNQSSSPKLTSMHQNVLKYNLLMTRSIMLLQQHYKEVKENPIDVIVFRPDFYNDLNTLINLAKDPHNNLDVIHPCMQSGAKGVSICKNPEGTVFWDGLHPNATAGCMLGQNITDYIEKKLNMASSYYKTDFNNNFVNQCKYTYVNS